MAKRLLKDKLIKKEDIDEELFLLEESNTDYITKTGKIYKDYGDDYFLQKKTFPNKVNGYIYINITNKENKNVSRRLHVLLAKTFIPNPNNYNVVGHKDNDKSNYDLNNLYWTNTSENTKKAFDDGLEVNDKSAEDSQSHQIACYTNNGTLISVYGSISEAGRCIEGLDKKKIHRMLKVKSTKYNLNFVRITKEEYYSSDIRDLYFSSINYIN